MRQKLITLCPVTWELAQRKTNFSGWIRDMLRKEQLHRDSETGMAVNHIERLQAAVKPADISTNELLYHLEQRSPDEIRSLVNILRNI